MCRVDAFCYHECVCILCCFSVFVYLCSCCLFRLCLVGVFVLLHVVVVGCFVLLCFGPPSNDTMSSVDHGCSLWVFVIDCVFVVLYVCAWLLFSDGCCVLVFVVERVDVVC